MTRMCEAEINVKVIQDTLEHKDISVTLNIYTDVTKKRKDSKLEALIFNLNILSSFKISDN